MDNHNNLCILKTKYETISTYTVSNNEWRPSNKIRPNTPGPQVWEKHVWQKSTNNAKESKVCLFVTDVTTVKTGSARKLGQSPIWHYPRSSAYWGYFRQFLTRLVQNLTLRNDCQYHRRTGPSGLSSQNDHRTVDDPQLSPWVVGFRLDSNLPLLARESGVLISRLQGIDYYLLW